MPVFLFHSYRIKAAATTGPDLLIQRLSPAIVLL
jgi:hypothetical protein